MLGIGMIVAGVVSVGLGQKAPEGYTDAEDGLQMNFLYIAVLFALITGMV